MNNKFVFDKDDKRIAETQSNGWQPFSHLHTHSDGSHDGLGTLDDLVKTAASRGFKHLALTEHGNLSSSIALTHAAKQYGIKPILGNEIYLEVGGNIHHLTLLADGNRGFDTLVTLNNIGKKGDLKRGAITMPTLLKHNENIIVLSGCPVSPMQDLELADARVIAHELKNVFGERFFIELMFTTNGSLPSWERSIQLSKDLDLPLVFTNDVHFVNKEYADLHMIYQNMKSYNRFNYDSKMLWLVIAEEMINRVNGMQQSSDLLNYLNIGMTNSFLLSEMIGEVKFSSVPKLPHIVNADKSLKEKVYAACASFPGGFSKNANEVFDRIEYELDVIISKGYATYFLIVEDLVTTAKNSGVLVGPGRGSAVGSFVAYLLGITEVNPLDYGLQFERFLNPNREAMPDIDTDIPASQRSIILDYAEQKYGATPIITQSRCNEKSLIRDLCRHFRTSKDEENLAAENGYNSDAFDNVARNYKNFRETYDVMIGQIRHQSKHAGGIVIAENVSIPLERMKDGTLATAWTEGNNAELSKAGIVKFDMLGLSSLDVLIELEKATGVKPPSTKDLFSKTGLPEFDLVKSGNVLGVFQLAGSDGMRDYAMKVAPNCIQDIIATVSLWRTGPIQAGAHELFLDARHGKPREIHPEIDEILKDTYGLIVYQEDFMRLYAWATSRDLGDADNARRVIVKYKPDSLDSVLALSALESEFKDGAISRGLDVAKANQLWDEIVTHTGYSFNKSHATAYSMITWKMLWYKYHYPARFYAALLNNDPDKTQEYIFNIISEGFEISLPDINKSLSVYTSDGNTIYVPLTAIKFLGENGVGEIIENRPYSSPEEFMIKVQKRQVTKRSRINLFELGSFNSIGGSMADYDIDAFDLLKVKKTATFKKLLKNHFSDYKTLLKIFSGEPIDLDVFVGKIDNNMKQGSFNELVFNIVQEIDGNTDIIESQLARDFVTNNYKNMLVKLIPHFSYNDDEKQTNYLGVVIPTKTRVDEINHALKNGMTAGVITSITRKISSYYKDRVYYTIGLFPGRTVWTPNKENLAVGQWIVGAYTKKTGKLIKSRLI